MSVGSLESSKVSGQYVTEQVEQALSKNNAAGNIPPVGSGLNSMPGTGSTGSELPSLDPPQTKSMGYAGLSLESLVTAIGNTERKQACAEGVDRLEKRGKEIAENNKLKLDEIAKNIETMKRQEKLGPFQEAFQWIGAILGAAASIATIVFGAVTANPLLITAASVGLAMTIDSMVSLGTDGKYSIAAGITTAAEKLGASEETAQWIAFGIQMAITVSTIIISFGSAGAGIGSAAGKIAAGTLNAMNKVQSGMQIASGVNSIASASAGIASTVFNYQVSMREAELVDLQAILEQIKVAQELEEAMIQAEMERSNSLLGSVNDIIDEANSTAQTILGGAPSMA